LIPSPSFEDGLVHNHSLRRLKVVPSSPSAVLSADPHSSPGAVIDLHVRGAGKQLTYGATVIGRDRKFCRTSVWQQPVKEYTVEKAGPASRDSVTVTVTYVTWLQYALPTQHSLTWLPLPEESSNCELPTQLYSTPAMGFRLGNRVRSSMSPLGRKTRPPTNR
jgi:hypothetical protein